jgi:hypothetical protein
MTEKGSVTQCLGKKRHDTIGKAEEVVDIMTQKYSKHFRYYYCGICGGYHVTSKPK